ncbi:hypothetical protein LOTGIDRAFT_209399 [Lottia gigantea]|uniref:Translation factor GUF1 homolog, mitochondrial n=1 Tax=Lottia gigantea TaxID=225164 RepID=V4AAR5_LOTGI|nr:hypothetical protein LOTGIDRAFT_209399 [Lottia gigantea]ESO93857.1 hypothetical protein LOTGIDRAFT_209399 [Lottia gigantea]
MKSWCQTFMKHCILRDQLFNTSKLNLSRRLVFGRYSSTNRDPSDNSGDRKVRKDLSEYPTERIRNFSIIAHVDHGKSTLADRLLEITGTIPKDDKNKQVLDKLQVERERGITVKAQTASLLYNYKEEEYLLNLVDTPGHVDFNYEVARSLSACQGVILLVDANQGVQAQTVANFYLAFEKDLTIIPVLNKIDLPGAQPDVVIQQIKSLFDIEDKDIFRISAKHGTGVEELLKTVIEQIPPPSGSRENIMRTLMIDSAYNQFRGVIALMSVIDGSLKRGDKITSIHSTKVYEVQDVGYMHPDEVPTDALYAGQVGYVLCNIRDSKEAQLGDTYFTPGTKVEALPGFKSSKPMVFGGIYPSDQSEFHNLKLAIEKLTLNDPSVAVHTDNSPVLGQGFRLGYLGLLHMDVFSQRLEQEYNANVISTIPNVPYKVKVHGVKNIKKYGSEVVTILNPIHLPNESIIVEMLEPMVEGKLLFPDDYLGQIMDLVMQSRGEILDQKYIDNKRLLAKVKLPLNEILVDFFDMMKSVTSGYGSFDYEDAGYEVSNLVKLDFLLNSRPVEELSLICHRSRARTIATRVCEKLKDAIPPQLFLISVQGAVGSKILCREDIKPYRKDVLAKCYGGDQSRKNKLLKKQAEGKKQMRKIGRVEIPKDAFVKILRR